MDDGASGVDNRLLIKCSMLLPINRATQGSSVTEEFCCIKKFESGLKQRKRSSPERKKNKFIIEILTT